MLKKTIDFVPGPMDGYPDPAHDWGEIDSEAKQSRSQPEWLGQQICQKDYFQSGKLINN